MLAYKVSVLNTVHDFFYYASPNCNPNLGDRVWVPFRNNKKIGIVIGETTANDFSFKLKDILQVIDDEPLLSPDILKLLIWVSDYYKAPLPLVLKLAIPKNYRQGKKISIPTKDYYNFNSEFLDTYLDLLKRAPKQLEIVKYISEQAKPIAYDILKINGFDKSKLKQLLDKNILQKKSLLDLPKNLVNNLTKPLQLNHEQQIAVDSICKSLNVYNCFLLKGVTGSGKTEVYLQVIAKVLQAKQQVLVIVPEIGLTPQLLQRFSQRFAIEIQVIHSALNDTERQHAWQLAKNRQAKLIIGTRSAVFTPMPDLGLIVIDEEHDLSLKQMDGVRYFARDTAIMRAVNSNIPIIMGSATPSLESIYNCLHKKYTLLELNNKAVASSKLQYQLLDVRNRRLNNGFAADTISLIGKHLEQGKQVLVFLNRRGFAPVLLCQDCGEIADCKNCDTHLSLHRSINKLICHHCGYTISKQDYCGKCHSPSLVAVGIGTQRAFEYLQTIFPTMAVLRVDRDEAQQKYALHNMLDKINSQQAQLIIGTQMLAKGHHFPNLTLVVVLDVDNGFYTQDFRALERLGQLLIQVAGRAGREENPGQVLIQTSLPNDPMLNILIKEGYDSFVNLLLEGREKSSLPPYSYLAILRASGKNQQTLLTFMHSLKDELQIFAVKVLGPAPAPIFKKNNQYRMQLLLKSNSRRDLHRALEVMKARLDPQKIPSGISFNIDVDPLEVA